MCDDFLHLGRRFVNIRKQPVFVIRALMIVAYLLVPLLVSGSSLAASGRIEIEVDGLHRSALLVEQLRLKKARRPLYIILHGSHGDGARIRRSLEIDEWLASTGAILVFPDALGGTWDVKNPSSDNPETSFIRALIAHMIANHTADSKRVFLIGASTGGMMALRIACDQSAPLSGVAVVISNMPELYGSSCHPRSALPFLAISGLDDPQIPYNGGTPTKIDYDGSLLSTDQTIKYFADGAHCAGPPEESLLVNRVKGSNVRAFLVRYQKCLAPVELIRVEGGGHHIPGHWSGGTSGAAIGAHNVDIDSARWIVDFFRRSSR